MKRKWSRWLRWPMVFVASAVAGWALTSAVVQRRMSALWQDLPTRRVSMYPESLGHGVDARVSRISKRGSLDDLVSWLAELAAETSPAQLRAALDAIRGLPDTWRRLAAETALARLADIDSRAAMDYAFLRLGDGSMAWNALANVLRVQAVGDPESLWPLVPAVARQLAFGQGGVSTLAKLNPDESLAFIKRWHLPFDHPGVQESIKGAIQQVAKTDPARALQTLGSFGVKLDEHWRRSTERIVQAWAKANPEAALQWIQQHSGNPNDPFSAATRGGFLEAETMGRIAHSDPERVVGWFASRAAVRDRWSSVDWVALHELQKVNPEAASRVLEMVPPQQRAAAASRALSPWGPDSVDYLDAKGAIRWVAAWPPEWRGSPPIGVADATLKDDEFQQWLALGVKLSPSAEAQIANQVERDPAGTVATFRNWTPAAQRSALPGIVAGLVNTEPAQAAALLQELPRGEVWATAAARLATEWSWFDRTAADTWINTLPPGTAQRLRAQVTKATTPR